MATLLLFPPPKIPFRQGTFPRHLNALQEKTKWLIGPVLSRYLVGVMFCL